MAKKITKPMVTLLFTPNDRFEALLTLETMHDKSIKSL